MKKRFLAYGAVAVVSVYAIAGFFGVPYALKHIAPEKITAASEGGKFGVESASFNPFTFALSVQKLSFKTPKDGDFIAIEHLMINVNPMEYLWKQRLVIEELRIENPLVSLQKGTDGEMNFGWLSGGEENNETAESSDAPALLIRNFTLNGGEIDYSDTSEGRNYREEINKLGFHLENIDLQNASNTQGMMRLYATINEGGFVDVRGKIAAMKPFKLEGSVAFDFGKLYTPWKYFKEKLPIEVADGKIAFRLDYLLNSDDINATKLSNLTVNVDKLRLIPKTEQHNLLSMNVLRLKNGTVFPLRKELSADHFGINGVEISASRSHSGVIDWLDYIEQIKAAFPEDENETKVPWQITVGDVSLENMGIRWSDNAPKEPYSVMLDRIHFGAQHLSSDPQKSLNLELKTGKMDVRRIRDSKSIAGFESIAMGQIALDREAKNAHIQNVIINGAVVSSKRLKNGTIDLQQLVASSRKTVDKKKDADEQPWSYSIDNFGLNDAKIGFVDEVPARKVAVDIDNLFVGIKNISSNPKTTMTVESQGRINQTTTIKISSQLRRESLQSKGDFELKHFPLPLIDPYIEPATYAALRRGDLGIKGVYFFTPDKTSVEGKISLNDWVVEERRDRSVLLGWNRIGVTPFRYTYPDNRLKINQLSVDGLYANVLFDQNKTLNFSTLSKAKKGDFNETRKEGNPFGVDIVKLAVVNSSSTFSDLSLPLPFKTYIHDLGGEVLGISTTKDVRTFVKLRGGVDEYGLAKINGTINTKDPKAFTDMHVDFENLELKNYTPYSLEFLGYKIANGKLFLNLVYKINQGNLDAQNKVVIKNIELGDEVEGGAKWPLKLVVALLEDSDGVIDIDLPVEGNVTDPNFRYGKVIWQVIGNLLTKAITAPFRLLGSLMGIDSGDDSLSKVSFEAGEDSVLPPEREKLDKLATLLAKRPKLTLKVHGGWAVAEDEHALQVQKLIASIIGQNSKKRIDSTDALSLETLEATAKKSMNSSEIKTLRAAMEEQYPQEAEFTKHYTAALIERLIVLQVIGLSELEVLAFKRANAVVDYLHKNPQLVSRVLIGSNEKSEFDSKEGIATRLELSVQ
ncbi:MAG: DUF748 domain-containing protein [Sulfuricurvum sp.]|nr:DUF748 domain-containing protein [Sulfuricurvum sp.]